MQAEKALQGAANAGDRFQAAGFFTAEAQTRLEEFADRMKSPIPLGAAVTVQGQSVFGPEGLGTTNRLLGDMLTLQKDRMRPVGLPTAEIQSGHVPASGSGIGY